MSFILDALRKSEHERQRQTGPALVESAVATPKPRTNRWATAAIALLVINLVALGVVLLMKSGNEPTPAATAPAAGSAAVSPSPSAGTASLSPQAVAPSPAAAPSAAPAAQAPVTRALTETPPMMRPAPPQPENAGRNPLEEEVTTDASLPDHEVAASAAAAPGGPAVVESAGRVRPGSVVYQSLPEADPVTSPTAAANPASDLPRADEITGRGGAPELRLELHVYSTRPAERIVFINSHQYREGETTQEGAKIEQITPDGVVMSMNGTRFLLPRD